MVSARAAGVAPSGVYTYCFSQRPQLRGGGGGGGKGMWCAERMVMHSVCKDWQSRPAHRHRRAAFTPYNATAPPCTSAHLTWKLRQKVEGVREERRKPTGASSIGATPSAPAHRRAHVQGTAVDDAAQGAVDGKVEGGGSKLQGGADRPHAIAAARTSHLHPRPPTKALREERGQQGVAGSPRVPGLRAQQRLHAAVDKQGGAAQRLGERAEAGEACSGAPPLAACRGRGGEGNKEQW